MFNLFQKPKVYVDEDLMMYDIGFEAKKGFGVFAKYKNLVTRIPVDENVWLLVFKYGLLALSVLVVQKSEFLYWTKYTEGRLVNERIGAVVVQLRDEVEQKRSLVELMVEGLVNRGNRELNRPWWTFWRR